jgi:membrane-associated phospholipid phosphatase
MFKIVPRDASTVLPAEVPGDVRCGSARRLFAAAGIFAALSAAALFVDLPVAQFMAGRGLPGELRRLVRLSEVFGWGGTVALIIVTAAVLDPRGWRVIMPLAIPAFGSGLVADGLKLLVARQRPLAADLTTSASDTFRDWLPLLQRNSLGQSYSHALQSFPSAHAATAAGLAIGLAALYPHGRWLFVAFAALAGLQRIEAQAHFTSDVLAGAALGCMVAAAAVGWAPPAKSQTVGSAPPTN